MRSDRYDPRSRTARDDGVDAVLVRVPISAERWAEVLPPAPAGAAVTVSFSAPSALDEHGEALELLGYRVLDGPSSPAPEQAAWLLIPRDIAEGRRAWWSSIRRQADRVYDLRFGPALHLLAPIVRAHLEPAGQGR